MDEAAALRLLGLAMRAGQVQSGDDLCEREVRAGRAALVLMDAGVSANTRDRYEALCRGRETPLYALRADALGRAIGKDNRMLAVVRRGPLADKIRDLLGR